MADLESIAIEIDGRTVPCARGSSLLNAIINAQMLVGTACGGRGQCHLCRVTILSGDVPAPTAIERRALGNVLLAEGVRLACRIPVEGPMRVQLPDVRRKGP